MPEKGVNRNTTAIAVSTCKILLILWIGIYLNCGLALAVYGSTTTGNYLNGNFWQLLNDFQKIIYINGIQDGLLLFLSQIKEDLLISPELMDAMKESGFFDRRRLLFSCQIASNIAVRIDLFYQDPTNLIIPIAEAYQHVLLELNFATPEDLAKNLSNLRRKYNQDY